MDNRSGGPKRYAWALGLVLVVVCSAFGAIAALDSVGLLAGWSELGVQPRFTEIVMRVFMVLLAAAGCLASLLCMSRGSATWILWSVLLTAALGVSFVETFVQVDGI